MTNFANTRQMKEHGKKSDTFYFKQFKVEDGSSTMKVGTDAVLLGAAIALENAGNILEIGTGCGVISLILAQRSNAMIDAVEIDEDSVSQAKVNVENSPWKSRINIINSSLQDFILQPVRKYDLVISNPPFFSRFLKSAHEKRNISRHNDSLSFDDLIEGSSKVMLPGASLWIILPLDESRGFVEKCVDSGLFVHYQLKIAHKKMYENRRIILQLKKTKPQMVTEHSMAIKNENGSFTKEYIELTKEFYLDF